MEYPVFSYDSFWYTHRDGFLEMTFHFSCGDEQLETVDTISGVTPEMLKKIPRSELDLYVFSLGLAEIPSYWKAFLSPTIQINCGALDATQIQFWQKLFYFGLGEFFYQNQIKPFKPTFQTKDVAGSGLMNQTPTNRKDNAPILVPVGGGKDSIVTLEELAQAGRPIYTWSGLKGASSSVIDLFGKRHPRMGDIIFTRTLANRLSALNASGYPNGHTPFSSVLAFFTLLTARLFEIPEIAISNEASSNEPTGTWEGIDINHQYSKSQEFETDFQAYVAATFGPAAPHYFSYLRQYSELEIMQKFVQYPEYFPVFRSCNVGQKNNTWCGECGKCAFVVLLLAAYLDDATIVKIFGKDVLGSQRLIPFIDQLIGKSEFKPFECVGTRTESKQALELALARRTGVSLPLLLSHYA